MSELTLVSLLEKFLQTTPDHGQVVSRSVLECPNCGATCDSTKSPYCSSQCREEAAFVRQLRRALAEHVMDEERRQSMGQELWHVLGGGFPERLKQVPERVRLQVLGRHGGKCDLCEKPAVEIDHIRTACNRPINLRPVCVMCRRTAELSDEPIGGVLWLALATRALSPVPLLACDDGSSWDWRDFLNRRKVQRQH